LFSIADAKEKLLRYYMDWSEKIRVLSDTQLAGFFAPLLLGLGLACLSPNVMATFIGQSLLPDGETSFVPFGPNAQKPNIQQVAVTDQPFTKALEVDTRGAALTKGKFGLTADVKGSMLKGDVLWLSVNARSRASSRETGESFIEVRLEQLVNGKPTFPAHVERGISFGKNWTETSFPFVLRKDVRPTDVRFVINFDHYPQKFELGPVLFINYGPNVKLSDLPRSTVRYEGDDANAAWRAQAIKRIEEIRKGDLTVSVVNAKGDPVPDAEVTVRMKRHAFNWGTAIQSSWILDQKSTDALKYREVLARYFNQVVYENELKTKYWEKQKPEERGAGVRQANIWLRERGFGIRGHVMVWPSWRQTPPLAAFKDDPQALRTKIFSDIADQTSHLEDQFDQWDVLNEPYANHNVQDILGYSEETAWFKAARVGVPRVKLFLNDYTLFQGQGPGSPSQHFYDTAKRLRDEGAPIDAIGEQGHIGGTPPGIPYVLERLDFMGNLGLPIQISEFDINSNDDEFKARYLDDFMTAAFSHPSVMGFVQWGFWAGLHWFPVAALWDENWNLRAHGKVYIERTTKTWWTNSVLQTDSKGVAKLRGFYGDYEITVHHAGRSLAFSFRLDADKPGHLSLKI